jgi:UPF0716 protein FxsA
MRKYIVATFITVSIIELTLFVLLSHYIGTLLTILLCLCTSMLGIFLVKKQGMKVMNDIKWQLHQGQMPGDAVLSGVCVMIGGILLMVPGYVTDMLGLLCIFPFTRKQINNIIKGYIQHRIFSYRR